MDKIRVMMVLHAYQPPYPIQERFVVDRIVENCYRPIAFNLEDHDNIKLVINMNASLTEMLLEAAPDVIASFGRSAEKGKVEFLESGAYHPIFPLVSSEQSRIQLEINRKINSEAFGSSYQPKGVWPPELAVDMNSLELFAENCYSYSMIPENSLPSNFPNKIAFLIHESKRFFLINRDKNLSNAISFNAYKGSVSEAVKDFKDIFSNRQIPIVIATDMETFGEHNSGYWEFMFDFLSHPEIESILSDTLVSSVEKIQVSEIFNSSWSTEDNEVKEGIPYPLWDHPFNPIHTIQHAHFSIVKHLYEEEKGLDKLSDEELIMYLKSAQSCQFWWADKHSGRWSPEIINKGIDFQRQAILYQENDLSEKFSNYLKKRLQRILKTDTIP